MPSIRRFDTAVTGTDFREFSYRLLNSKNYLPDVLRDYKALLAEYTHTMDKCCQPFAVVDKDNKLAGMFFINDIVPGHKGTFFCWMWGKGCSCSVLKFMKEYIDSCAEEYQLSRVECRTPDENGLGRLLKALKFKLEGRLKFGYKSGGRLTTLFCYRLLYGGV
jgi:RimJ/RimL family protein N-acetyltransferase